MVLDPAADEDSDGLTNGDEVNVYGSDPTDTWFVEERNVFDDYRAAFGSDPPPVVGIGLMTDSDNTGEKAVAYYGDITLLKRPVK